MAEFGKPSSPEESYDMGLEKDVFDWLNSNDGYVKAVIDEYRETHSEVVKEELVDYVYEELTKKYMDFLKGGEPVKNAIRKSIANNYQL